MFAIVHHSDHGRGLHNKRDVHRMTSLHVYRLTSLHVHVYTCTCTCRVVHVYQLPDSNGVLGSSSAATAARACVSPSCAPADDDMVPYACAASGGASRRTCCVSRSGSVPIMTSTRVSMSSPQNDGRTVSCEFAETATHKQILHVVTQ